MIFLQVCGCLGGETVPGQEGQSSLPKVSQSYKAFFLGWGLKRAMIEGALCFVKMFLPGGDPRIYYTAVAWLGLHTRFRGK